MVRILFGFVLFLYGISGFAQSSNAIEGEIYVKIKTIHISKIKTVLNNGKEETELPGLRGALKNKNKLTVSKISKVKGSKNGLERIYKVKIDSTENIEQILKDLKNSGLYEYVEKKYARFIIANPNDPGFATQWSLKKVKAPQAWDINPGGAQVIVAVIDNAIQTTHPDLQANMLRGFDASDNDLDPNPPDSTYTHGTHVAGIVSAVTNNGIGISSAGNNKVKVLPIKATPNGLPPNSIYDGFEGIVMAVDSGANIISISWGGTGASQAEQEIINYARANNVLVVSAAGNSNNDVKIYPAAYNNVISVASTDSTDVRSSFSSYGSTVDIAAPGRGILSTIPFNKYINFSGTSMATPLVSSALGYLWSCFPTLTIDQIEALLKNTADKIDIQNPTFIGKLGSGRVNMLNAVACKTLGLDAATVTIPPSMFICPGDSIILNTTLVAGTSYKWYHNNTLLTESSNILKASALGVYKLNIKNGLCDRTLSIPEVKSNPLKSAIPIVTDIEKNYCQGADTLKITGNLGAFSNSFEYNYTGPQVGYDANLSSGPNPNFEINDLPGFIDSINVSITWIKKDGGNFASCGIADGGEGPFNEELGFSLKSPSGKIYNLVLPDTYLTGAVTSGVVTTVFKMNAATFASGLPISGSFKPVDSFSDLFGKVGLGSWTLLPVDNSEIDPLCVSGFKIKFYTNANTSQPHVSWWSAASGGTLLSNTTSLIQSNLPIGTHTFYVQNRCDFFCVSDIKPAKIIINNVPKIVGVPFSKVILTFGQYIDIQNAQSTSIFVDNNFKYYIQGIKNTGQPFSYLLSNYSPEVSPVTICGNVDYLLLGTGCSGQISWSTGEVNSRILIQNMSVNSQITASCIQSWTCTTPPPANFDFMLANGVKNLSKKIVPNSLQDFYGTQVFSNQIISPVSKINYTGSSSIVLQPGFSAEKGNFFKAQIGVCP
jgi:serine protease